jgi:hypothetical protein
LPAPDAGAPVAPAAADEATDEATDLAEVSASEAADATEEAAEVADDSAAGVVLVADAVFESSVRYRQARKRTRSRALTGLRDWKRDQSCKLDTALRDLGDGDSQPAPSLFSPPRQSPQVPI